MTRRLLGSVNRRRNLPAVNGAHFDVSFVCQSEKGLTLQVDTFSPQMERRERCVRDGNYNFMQKMRTERLEWR